MRQFQRAGFGSSMLIGVCLFAALGIGLLPAPAAAQSNPIVIENQQPGTSAWQISDKYGTDAVGEIKGYASAVSVNKGGSIDFKVSTNPAQTFTIDVYRMGWYQGLGGRLMLHAGPISGIKQPTCPMNATTGMIECSWPTSYTLATQTSWTSGIYLVLLTNQNGFQNTIMFCVRDDNRVAPLLYQQPVTTYQAYNNWPNDGTTGKSLYDFNSYGAKTVSGYKSAAKVSFDRPYYDTGINEDFLVSGGEINFIHFVEKNGYDISYSTDVDTHTNGSRLLNYRGVLSVGHDEYWSKQMNDAFYAARDSGVNLGFFGADTDDWQIRFESSSAGTTNRVIVCYRDATIDPNTDPTLETIEFRDPPVSRAQQMLLGGQYTSITPQGGNGLYATYVVTNSSNWVYAGTGFKDGDTVPGLVGYEADKLFSNYPGPSAVPGTFTLLSHSPYQSAQGPDYANSSVYQVASGAWVFTSGSMNWNWGLDSYQHGIEVIDARIQQTTKNILNRFIINVQPDFSIDPSPASQTVAPGGSTTYSIVVTPKNGFGGAVTMSVSGLPTGVTGTFAPNPTNTSSTLSITTSASSPIGAYTITVTGVSGALTHTATLTLGLFPPDFALGTTPSSQTVTPGTATSYSMTIAATGGFTGAVNLSVAGLPAGAAGTFAPNPATASSTLSVTTGASTPLGTYTLTITGVSGSLTHTTTVSLTVQATPPPPVGVAFDAIGPSSAGASVSSGSSLSWTHTVTPTGANLLLTVAVAVGKSPDTGLSLAATYNGVAMTSAAIVHSNNVADGFVQMFYLKAPATGAHTVQVTLTGGTATSMEGGSVSFSNVDQTTPVRNITTSFGSGASPSIVVPSAQGDMVVDAMVTGCDGNMTSSQTLRWLDRVNCSTAGGNGAQSTAAGAASVTMGYTVPSDYWGMIGIDVVGATGPPPPPSFDFALTNEGNKSVAPGSAVTNAVTATLSSGSAQAVTFTVSGLPAGVTAGYNPTSCSPTCSTTLTLTAGASAVSGTSTITVTGTAGSVVHTTTFSLTVNAPDFSLSAAPASQTVAHGLATSYNVTINPTNGFTAGVTLSVTGLPAGAVATPAPNPATTTATITVTTDTTTPAGSYPLTITGVSGSLTHTTTATLVVTAPDFSLSATPASQTVAQGLGTSYSLTVNPTNGFASGVTLSVTGLPTGAGGTFAPNPATTSSTLSVTTAATTPAGSYTLTITGVSGSLTHTTTATLVVTAPDFSLSATPGSQTVAQGLPTSYGLTINPTNGFTGGVTLSVTGLPAGAGGTFTPNPATSTSTLSVTTAATTPAGSYTLTITGVSGSLTHTTTVTLVVTAPDFTLSATPPSQAVTQGLGASYNVTISPTNGFASGVTLSVTGLPTGAGGTFTPNPATTAAALSVTTNSSTPAGSYTLTITGVSGSLTHTTTVTLVVTDFSLSATPASQTVTQGLATGYNVTITPISGFSGGVTLSVSGLPSGAAGAFTPNPATTASTLSVTTNATTPTGTYPLTITGVSGSLTHTANVSLTVVNTPPPPVGVAFDAIGPGAGGVSVSSGSTLSWSHTVTPTGLNPLLTVAVAVGKSPDTGLSLAVTYGGVPMTSAGIMHANNATSGFVQMFYLRAPLTGANTVQVTLTGGTASSMEGGSVSFTGVDQTTPVRNITTNFGSSTSPSVVVPSAPGDMVVDAMVTGCNGTITSSQTLRWLNQVNCATAGGNGAQSTAAGAASVTMGYAVPNDYWGMIGMDLVAGVPSGPFDFTLSNQGDKSVAQGLAVTNTVTASLSSGASHAVTFSAAGLPTGVTASYNPSSCSPSCNAIVTFTADTAAPLATSLVTVTATDGIVSHSTTFNLTVAPPPPPDFTVSATPATQTILAGAAASYNVTINPLNGFNSGVTLSVSGLPAGAVGTFTPNPATGSATLSVTTSGTTPSGPNTLTITGVSGSLTHTATVTLTVNTGVTVTAPNTAVSWMVTTTQSITFTHNLGVGQPVNIDVSRDSGATWSPITVFTTTSATTGTYAWVVSGPPTTHARIRVSSAANPLVSDMSDVDFTVTNPTVTVTAPNTAVSWRAGDTKNITFSHTLGVGKVVNIDVSRDAGATWTFVSTFTTTSATAGTVPWVVSGPATNQARIRVSWTVDPVVTDTSNVNFTILARTTVTAPNTAVNWGAGSTRQVTWSHNLGKGGLVDIDFSPDNGVTWVAVAHSVASSATTTGTYTGPMPTTVTTQGLIRVAPSADPTAGDVSDVPFTLATPTITVTAPNTAVSWTAGTTQAIKWNQNLGTLDSVRIELARDGVNYTETIAASVANSAATTGTFNWVVTGPSTTTAKVRVTWVANGAISDTSNVNFTIP